MNGAIRMAELALLLPMHLLLDEEGAIVSAGPVAKSPTRSSSRWSRGR